MTNKSIRMRACCGLAAAAVILLLLYVPSRSHGQLLPGSAADRVGVIPDSHGTIAEILLHYDPDVAYELEPAYRDLLAALPNDVRVKVLCPTAVAADELIWSWETLLEKRVVDVINVGLPISIWARDRCIARQSLELRHPGTTFVPVPPWDYEEEKSNDLLIQDILHEARLAPAVMNSPLHVEGGNVVSNRRHAFFGANVLSENSELTDSRMERELSRLAGREVLSVGHKSGEAPWCHIDMYLTPIGDDTVLVASPQFATEILSDDGDCDDGWDHWGELPSTACPSDLLQEQLDSVATLAERNGYRVYRMPVIADVVDQWMITYNNILLDERGDQRVVYMPVYAVPPLDQVAAAIYRGFGFEVHTVDVSRLYTRGGAVRCLANVTRRRQPCDVPQPARAEARIRFIDLAGSRSFDGILDRCRHRLARRGHRDVWSLESWP